MNQYEYDGETVITFGIDVNGDHYVETSSGFSIVDTETKLEAGAMVITVGEVCNIYDVHHAGQSIIGPRRS